MQMQKIEPAGPPMPAVARILSRYDRQQVEGFIEIAVALLDTLDGDPDLEGQCDEDEISRCADVGRPVPVVGPGCTISDPGGSAEGEDDEEDDHSGQCTEDEISCGPGHWGSLMRDWQSAEPGCPISDPGGCQYD